jgi:dTDP-glucose 4,6-dehydratase
MAECDYVVNFAAETPVDRSIHDAGDFIRTDVYGTFVLLEAIRSSGRPRRFIQISTDEIYGAIETGSARETDPSPPQSLFRSKAGADRLAYSYFVTHGVPVIVTRASNNTGLASIPRK